MKLCQQKPEWQREVIARNLSLDENQMKSQTSRAARRKEITAWKINGAGNNLNRNRR
jgi:hypothetical protein